MYRIYLAKHRITREKALLKMIKTETMQNISIDEIQEEIQIIKNLPHKNITQIIDSRNADLDAGEETYQVFYIALEISSNEELFDYITHTGVFTEDVARYFFHQLIEGIEHLHNQGMSHRNLKTKNMILDDEFNLRISDFATVSSKSKYKTQVGTESYMAPEVHLEKEYSGQSADIF